MLSRLFHLSDGIKAAFLLNLIPLAIGAMGVFILWLDTLPEYDKFAAGFYTMEVTFSVLFFISLTFTASISIYSIGKEYKLW